MSLVHSPCDAAIAQNQDESGRVDHPGLVIATTILASSLAFIDGSVVNVGLPTIGASLGADAVGLQWVVNAYLLPLSALLLLGGAAGDRFGSRRLLMIGVGMFGAASIACAMAPSLGWLLAARFVQGVSAAILMPSSLAILGQSFSGEAKGRAIGIWAAAGAAGGALGPVLGGWLIDAGNWRLIFLINVPLAAAAIALAFLYVGEDADEGSNPLDATGAILATAGLGLATWALTEGSGRGWSIAALVALVAGGLLLMVFVLAERKFGAADPVRVAQLCRADGPYLPAVRRARRSPCPDALSAIEAGGYTATQAGAALLPLPVVLALASPAAGALAGKIGPRWPLVIGPIIVAAGFLLALRIGSQTSYWFGVLPAMIVIAVGMAGAVAPLTTAVLMSVDSHHVGAASGLNSAVARTGGLVATAMIGSVMSAVGPALVSAFGAAALVGAALCLGASLSAWFCMPRWSRRDTR